MVVRLSSLVVKWGCPFTYTNENSYNGNQKARNFRMAQNVVFLLNKNRNCNLFLVSHCYSSVEPIYARKELVRLP